MSRTLTDRIAHEIRAEMRDDYWGTADNFCGPIQARGFTVEVDFDGFDIRSVPWIARCIVQVIDCTRHRTRGYRFVPTGIMIEKDYAGRSIMINGDVISPDGTCVGDWEREFVYNTKGRPKHVYHSSFTITYESCQGKGIGSSWIRSCARRYCNSGFKRIEVNAAGDNGRYTWARLGFKLKNKERRNLWYRWIDFSDEFESALEAGVDEQIIKIAKRMIRDGIPKKMQMQDVANLGRGYESEHLGKKLLMRANSWDGFIETRNFVKK